MCFRPDVLLPIATRSCLYLRLGKGKAMVAVEVSSSFFIETDLPRRANAVAKDARNISLSET